MANTVTIQNPIRVNKAKPVDYMYGPYESLAAAKSFIVAGARYPGMTIGVIVAPNVIKEYWFNGGTADINLVEKQVSDGQDLEAIKNRLKGIEDTVPQGTSEENPLVNKQGLYDAVISTSAHYISDKGKPFTSFDALEGYNGEVVNNDYAFVRGVSDLGTVTYTRYKYNQVVRMWAIEYVIDTSSFTPEELNDLQNTITGLLSDVSSLKERVSALEQGSQNAQNAETVNGYRIQVMLPRNFNIETADPHTIYFLYKLGDKVVAIPSKQVYTYVPGGSITPVEGIGWVFASTPTPRTNVGEYQYNVVLAVAGAMWEDGTTEGKTLDVEVKPYQINVLPAISIRTTGEVIPISSIISVPNGVTCSYNIIEGGAELKNPGVYRIVISVNDPNCVFKLGNTLINESVEVVVTITQASSNTWKFGDSFPIIFSDGNDTPSEDEEWVFGNGFPIIFS
jgi:hypothetical protein